ncbi:hypothetical protein [Niameybacter massiliensis]|uniref:hypothetical protein n=1 Tax=Niameybacter massiliensis TaxID=1658108 RepID=UPI0006B578FB|nr:hypothetical protein [Niameybacter massiliensis]
MRTAEDLVVQRIDQLIGIVKAKALLEVPQIRTNTLAHNLVLCMCEQIKVGIWNLVDVGNKRIDRGVNSLLVQAIEQVGEYKRHPYFLEDEISLCDEFIEAVEAIKAEYMKLKQGEKQQKKSLVIEVREYVLQRL